MNYAWLEVMVNKPDGSDEQTAGGKAGQEAVTAKGVISLPAVPTSGWGEVWGLSHILQREREERGPRKDQGGSTCSR